MRDTALGPEELKAYGLSVAEVPGWEVRRSSSFGFEPVGFMLHHTAGRDSYDLIVSKALVQYYIPKSGHVFLVSNGRTAHPGAGSSVVLDEVKRDVPPSGDLSPYSPRYRGQRLSNDVDGYRWFVGVEVENLGDGTDPYTSEQISAMVRLAAAHCREFGWSPARVIHHREWTDRKIDMSYYEDVRAMVRADLALLESKAKMSDLTGTALDQFNKAIALGFTSGSDPNGFAERDEAAVMAYRAYEAAVEVAAGIEEALQAELAELRADILRILEERPAPPTELPSGQVFVLSDGATVATLTGAEGTSFQLG